jgi:VTC domain
MRCSPADLAARLPGAGLEAADALLDRVDRKYVVSLDQLAALIDALRGTHAVLEIGGRRAFGYETTYFDTPELLAFHEHVQQRRRRFKCRARVYTDSGACTFEVKLKGPRGRTVKHRMAYERERRRELSGPAAEFLRDCVRRAYGRVPDARLRASLVVSCTRMTLLGPGERVTCDFGLAFRAPGGAGGRMGDDAVIVESKSATGAAAADRVLRDLGARPVEQCSKYCLGIALTHPGVRRNSLLPLLRRHFTTA